MIVRIKRLPNLGDFPLPQYARKGDSGMDLRACFDQSKIVVKPMERVKIPTGVALELPYSVEAQVRPRSSFSLRGILIYWGTCDSAYTGEICVVLQNLSGEDLVIERGDRIAQLVIAEPIHCELEEINELRQTERNSGGFGSTGVK